MNNSIEEIKSALTEQFSGSADLSVRSLRLKSARGIRAAVFTVEGMVDKEGLAQTSLNPLLAFDFGQRDADGVYDTALHSVLASSDVTEIEGTDEIIKYMTSGFAVLAVDGVERSLARGGAARRARGLHRAAPREYVADPQKAEKPRLGV